MTRDARPPLSAARRRLLAVAAAIGAAAWLSGAGAQSLDDQYAYYLDGKCQKMNFARGANSVLLPGQAGPDLKAYCSGPPPTAGRMESSGSGGGAAAEQISAAAGAEERALRRRCKRLRSSATTAATDPADIGLGSLGAASFFLTLDYRHWRQKGTAYGEGNLDRFRASRQPCTAEIPWQILSIPGPRRRRPQTSN